MRKLFGLGKPKSTEGLFGPGDPGGQETRANGESTVAHNGSPAAVLVERDAEGMRELPPAMPRASASFESDLARIAPVADDRIRKFVAKHDKIRVIVDRTGTVYIVRDPEQHLLVAELEKLLSSVFPKYEFKDISPADYSIARQNLKEPVDKEKSRNPDMDWLISNAIDRKVSDIYLDVRNEWMFIYFKTYGRTSYFHKMSKSDGLNLIRSLWSQDRASSHFQADKPCDCSFGLFGWRIRGNNIQDTRGNSVAFRLRDPKFVLPLNDLGYTDLQVRQITAMREAGGGLCVISGETGSGKSTTMSSIMTDLKSTVRAIEVADPIEVEYDHIVHVPIKRFVKDEEGGFQAIRGALVRQNPDFLFLGEIRDHLTAAAVKELAVQGKVVWSTVHTQTCTTAIPRLEHLGVDHHLLALPGFLTGIINQNLVTVVCPECCLETHPDAKVDDDCRSRFGSGIRFINEAGCDDPHCDHGASGQTLVAEVFPLCMDEDHQVHRYILDRDMVSFEKHMRMAHDAHSKHTHAREKIAAGVIDPELTENIIGRIAPE